MSRRTTSIFAASFFVLLTAFQAFQAGETWAATITVNSTSDADADDGLCTLREAIEAANTNGGSGRTAGECPGGEAGFDEIVFDMGEGVKVIAPFEPLPTIIEPVSLNGFSAPGARPNTLRNGNNALITVEIDGVHISSLAGLTIHAGESVVKGLAISRFLYAVRLLNKGGNYVQGNFIGTGPGGDDDAKENNCIGILIGAGSNANSIGGELRGEGNIISNTANGGVGCGYGLQILGDNNTVDGNFIGTTASGTGAAPNATGGIYIEGHNNTIGGSSSVSLISGNGGNGITLSNNATGNQVLGNLIGTDVSGASGLPNTGNGVSLENGASTNTIGGTLSAARNVLSGNGGSGVFINAAGGNTIQGNFIGTDVTGAKAVGNTLSGVTVSGGFQNTIGGTTSDKRNVISGNGGVGVSLTGAGTTGNVIQGNFIGVDTNGAALGNADSGVQIGFTASNNTIGGTVDGAGNTIAFNGAKGVLVSSGSGNSILSNSIFSNTGLGIDLGGDGATPNDPNPLLDADAGANDLQNFPVIGSVVASGGSTTIHATLNSLANTIFRIEFFQNSDCGDVPNAKTRIGAATVTTNGNGDVTDAGGGSGFNFILPVSVFGGVTATATKAVTDVRARAIITSSLIV